MPRKTLQTHLLTIMMLSLLLMGNSIHVEKPIVHAVLFYSDSCPHCHKVITEDLPVLMEQYGEQLIIIGINTQTEQGVQLYQDAITRLKIPQERIGVPTLIVGEFVLVGSFEIPLHLPEIVERGLQSDEGIDWPDIPGLQNVLEAEGLADPEKNFDIVEEGSIDDKVGASEDLPISTGNPEQAEIVLQELSFAQRFLRDKVGNSIAVIVLTGMVLSLAGVGMNIARPKHNLKRWPNWVIPALVLIGIGVATYMGYVEIKQTEAVCGPVGDCNTVQQSPYAYLFGVIPIGIFGVIGYLFVGIMWLILNWGTNKWQKPVSFILWGLGVFGTIFSIYLTFLEPFVIGATCAWCLTSAIIMTLILWASTPHLLEAWEGA